MKKKNKRRVPRVRQDKNTGRCYINYKGKIIAIACYKKKKKYLKKVQRRVAKKVGAVRTTPFYSGPGGGVRSDIVVPPTNAEINNAQRLPPTASAAQRLAFYGGIPPQLAVTDVSSPLAQVPRENRSLRLGAPAPNTPAQQAQELGAIKAQQIQLSEKMDRLLTQHKMSRLSNPPRTYAAARLFDDDSPFSDKGTIYSAHSTPYKTPVRFRNTPQQIPVEKKPKSIADIMVANPELTFRMPDDFAGVNHNSPYAQKRGITESMADILTFAPPPTTPLASTYGNTDKQPKLNPLDVNYGSPDANGIRNLGRKKGASGQSIDKLPDYEKYGLSNHEIDGLVTIHFPDGGKGTPRYLGTYEFDNIPSPSSIKARRFGMILTKHRNIKDPNQGHWVAVYVDADKDYEINYYDSYGERAPRHFLQWFKELGQSLDTPYMLKYKWNNVVHQRNNTVTCGWHALKFLEDRFKGEPFKRASGFSKEAARNDSALGERRINQYKREKLSFNTAY